MNRDRTRKNTQVRAQSEQRLKVCEEQTPRVQKTNETARSAWLSVPEWQSPKNITNFEFAGMLGNSMPGVAEQNRSKCKSTECAATSHARMHALNLPNAGAVKAPAPLGA